MDQERTCLPFAKGGKIGLEQQMIPCVLRQDLGKQVSQDSNPIWDDRRMVANRRYGGLISHSEAAEHSLDEDGGRVDEAPDRRNVS